ncbi:MAG: tetratricopeptide repeat protein [Planctomycetota bacterium]
MWKKAGARRSGLYSGAALLIGLLLWAGFVYEPEPSVEDRLASIRLYAQVQAFEPARAEVRALLERNPSHLEGLLWDAYFEELSGRPSVAAAIYRNVLPRIEEHELRLAVQRSLSANCLKSGRPRSALKAGRAIVEQEPEDAIAWLLIALSCFVLGDDKSFLDNASRAYALDPGHRIFRQNPATVLPPGPQRSCYEALVNEALVKGALAKGAIVNGIGPG